MKQLHYTTLDFRAFAAGAVLVAGVLTLKHFGL